VQAVFEFGYMGYAISPSVTNGTLTLTIQRENAANPAAQYPVRFQLGTSFHYLTSATSFSAATGTNWCNAGGAELVGLDVDFFVYAIEETGASAGLKFGFSRIPYSETMNDFVNTSTDEKYIKGNYTNFNTSDKVKNIGRFRARLSSGNVWSIPTSKVVNRPIFETDWLSWTRVYTGFSSDTSHSNSRYKVVYDQCAAYLPASALGTSNSTSTTATFPFKFPVTNSFICLVEAFDSGAHQSALGHLSATANSNVGTLYKSIFQGAWTNSGAKSFNIPQFSYPIR
jgi:hypothetical protein